MTRKTMVPIALILALVILLIPGSVFSASQPVRLADHLASSSCTGCSASGKGLNPHMAFSDADTLIVFGGGNLGSGIFERDVFKYTVSTDTWSTLGLNGMPSPGSTSKSFNAYYYGGYIVAGSNAAANYVTFRYNVAMNTWESDSTDPDSLMCQRDCYGVGAGQYYYVMNGRTTGPTYTLHRLDVTGSLSTWTTLTGPPNSITVPSTGAPNTTWDIATNRLVTINRLGATFYYDIDTDTWTNLGSVFTPTLSGNCTDTCTPDLIWYDNTLGVLAMNIPYPSVGDGQIYHLDYDLGQWVTVTDYPNWTFTDWNYFSPTSGSHYLDSWASGNNRGFAFPHATVTQADGSTLLLFGGGTSGGGTSPSVNANRWWKFAGDPPPVPVADIGDIDDWLLSFLGVFGLHTETDRSVAGMFMILGLMLLLLLMHVKFILVGSIGLIFASGLSLVRTPDNSHIVAPWIIVVIILAIMLIAAYKLVAPKGSAPEDE